MIHVGWAGGKIKFQPLIATSKFTLDETIKVARKSKGDHVVGGAQSLTEMKPGVTFLLNDLGTALHMSTRVNENIHFCINIAKVEFKRQRKTCHFT